MARKDSQRIIEIREKANQQRREQQRREKRKTLFVQMGIVGGVLLLVGAIVAFVVINNNNRVLTDGPSASGEITLPGAGTDIPLLVGVDGVTVGKADAPVTIDVWEDYSCPHCATYEKDVGQTLMDLAGSGDVLINFHPVVFVTNYGLTAGSAATCVAANDPENWPKFHSAAFANHTQQTDGWNALDFVKFAQSQGIKDLDTLACITDETYRDWMMSSTQASKDADVTGTPTIFVDGVKYPNLLSSQQLIDLVAQLKG